MSISTTMSITCISAIDGFLSCHIMNSVLEQAGLFIACGNTKLVVTDNTTGDDITFLGVKEK